MISSVSASPECERFIIHIPPLPLLVSGFFASIFPCSQSSLSMNINPVFQICYDLNNNKKSLKRANHNKTLLKLWSH